MNEQLRPLGAVEHLGGAIAFVGSLTFGIKIVEAAASAVYGLGDPGGSMQFGSPSWDAGGHVVAPALMGLAFVAGTVAAFDQWLLNSRHRIWIPPLMVWIGLAALVWATGGRGPRHQMTIPAALGIGSSAALLFSAWWLVALGIARLRRGRLGRERHHAS
jgi:hypothetical protein